MIINPHYLYLKKTTPSETPYVSFSSDGFFSIQLNGSWNGTLEFSRDKETWSSIAPNSTVAAVEEDNKYELFFRGLGNTVLTGSGNSWVYTGNDDIEVEGNILMLLNYLDTSLVQMGNYCFSGLFRNWSTMTTAPTLPSTTLSNYCYQEMFAGCASLTEAPALPAMILANACYQGMFSNCSSLLIAPTLAATTLTNNCYENMFAGCSSLTTATTLPATIATDSCYSNMFLNCRSLTTIPQVRAANLVNMCYASMFSGCSLVKISATQEGEYVNAYPIGVDGTYTFGTFYMFADTGGTFTGTPNGGTTYYTSNTVV